MREEVKERSTQVLTPCNWLKLSVVDIISVTGGVGVGGGHESQLNVRPSAWEHLYQLKGFYFVATWNGCVRIFPTFGLCHKCRNVRNVSHSHEFHLDKVLSSRLYRHRLWHTTLKTTTTIISGGARLLLILERALGWPRLFQGVHKTKTWKQPPPPHLKPIVTSRLASLPVTRC